jgi:hypothetical protein
MEDWLLHFPPCRNRRRFSGPLRTVSANDSYRQRTEGIFKSEALPKDLVTEYMADLKRAEDDIDTIDKIIQNITFHIFTLVKKRAGLVRGEQLRTVMRLNWFITNVQNMIMTH